MNILVSAAICVFALLIFIIGIIKKNKTWLSLFFGVLGSVTLVGGVSLIDASMWRNICISFIALSIVFWGIGFGLLFKKEMII